MACLQALLSTTPAHEHVAVRLLWQVPRLDGSRIRREPISKLSWSLVLSERNAWRLCQSDELIVRLKGVGATEVKTLAYEEGCAREHRGYRMVYSVLPKSMNDTTYPNHSG